LPNWWWVIRRAVVSLGEFICVKGDIHLGRDAINLLEDLPSEGALFPYLASVRAAGSSTPKASR